VGGAEEVVSRSAGMPSRPGPRASSFACMSTSDVRAQSEASPSSVKTLARGLEILQLFSEDDPELSQSDIASRCGLPMPTVHRLVGTLVGHGFLEPVAGGRNLRLGSTLLQLAGPLIARSDPTVVIRPKLHELSKQSGETTNLAMLLGPWVVYLDGVTGSRMLTPQATIGARISAHNTALGKALLAQLDDAEVKERIGEGPYHRTTKRTAADWPELKKRLDEVRKTGISISDEEYEIGLTSIAIALPPQSDGTLRGINISLPLSRATEEFRVTAIAMLRDVAAAVAAR